MPRKHDMDRSTMFTCLLDLSPKYGAMESRDGSKVVTAALAAWYDSTHINMYEFTKGWIRENRKDLLPLRERR